MEVTAQLRSLLLLLVTVSYSQTHGAGFPQVDPDRQQHFDGHPLAVNCEGLNGLTGWRVMKRVKGTTGPCTSNWETSTGPCRIESAFAEYDSGEYWCEMGGKQRSNTINITVIGGSVILESPVHPVTEGGDVTLGCRTKLTSSSFITEFYKDGSSIGRNLTGNIPILNLSRSDEGFYKCSISDVGESPESWLSIVSEAARMFPEESPPLDNPRSFFLLLCLGGSVFLVLLLLLGFLLCKTHQPARGQTEETTLNQGAPISSIQSFFSPQTDEEHQPESSAAKQIHTTYATITKPRRVEESSAAEQMHTTYATVTKPRSVKELEASSESAPWTGTETFLKEEYHFYNMAV